MFKTRAAKHCSKASQLKSLCSALRLQCLQNVTDLFFTRWLSSLTIWKFLQEKHEEKKKQIEISSQSAVLWRADSPIYHAKLATGDSKQHDYGDDDDDDNGDGDDDDDDDEGGDAADPVGDDAVIQ